MSECHMSSYWDPFESLGFLGVSDVWLVWVEFSYDFWMFTSIFRGHFGVTLEVWSLYHLPRLVSGDSLGTAGKIQKKTVLYKKTEKIL